MDGRPTYFDVVRASGAAHQLADAEQLEALFTGALFPFVRYEWKFINQIKNFVGSGNNVFYICEFPHSNRNPKLDKSRLAKLVLHKNVLTANRRFGDQYITVAIYLDGLLLNRRLM